MLEQELKVLWIGYGTEAPGYNGKEQLDGLLIQINVIHV